MDVEFIKSKFIKNSGILKTSELSKFNVSSRNIKKLISDGVIEKIRFGYYRLVDNEDESEIGVISRLFPDSVICMCSALFYYGYSDRTPLQWDICINKNAFKKRFDIDYPLIKPYFVTSDKLSYGVTNVNIDGCLVKIFDRDRLICECLKSESKMDNEVFNKAIHNYISDPQKNIDNLIKYCEKRKATKKMQNILGVWL